MPPLHFVAIRFLTEVETAARNIIRSNTHVVVLQSRQPRLQRQLICSVNLGTRGKNLCFPLDDDRPRLLSLLIGKVGLKENIVVQRDSKELRTLGSAEVNTCLLYTSDAADE